MRYLLVVLMLSLMAVGQGQDAASLASKVDKTDPALTNARTPTAHTHPEYIKTVNGSGPDGSGNVTVAAGGFQTGDIIFRISACNAGWTELTAPAGKYLLLTTVSAGDAGQTVAASTSLTAAAQTFHGSSTTVPALGYGTIAATQASDTFSSTKMTTNSSGTAALTAESARGAITISGSTATGTLTPNGYNDTSAVTGTVVVAGFKVIACQKN